jgi:hypothetical protein
MRWFLYTIVLVLGASCQYEDSHPNLIVGKWQEIDSANPFVYEFRSDGTYTLSYVTNNWGVIVTEGKWILSDNDKHLLLDVGDTGFNTNGDVMLLTASEFWYNVNLGTGTNDLKKFRRQ